MKSVIKLDIPEYQIGEVVTVYFKDTMIKKGIIEVDQNIDNIKEEIKVALEYANKDIDLMPEQEEYMRGYLGGQLSIVRILEKNFGKFIDDDDISELKGDK